DRVGALGDHRTPRAGGELSADRRRELRDVLEGQVPRRALTERHRLEVGDVADLGHGRGQVPRVEAWHDTTDAGRAGIRGCDGATEGEQDHLGFHHRHLTDRQRARESSASARKVPNERVSSAVSRPRTTNTSRLPADPCPRRCSGRCTTCCTPLTVTGSASRTFSTPLTRSTSGPCACSSKLSHAAKACQSTPSPGMTSTVDTSWVRTPSADDTARPTPRAAAPAAARSAAPVVGRTTRSGSPLAVTVTVA